MRELGHFEKQLQFRNLERLEKAENFEGKKVETVDSETKKYTIEEILDRVEEGDVSILVELGISYTEYTTETGAKKISFKFEGVRYTVTVIDNANGGNGTEETTGNSQTVKNDDGSYTVFEYDLNGVVVKTSEYDKDGRITHEFLQNADGSRSDKYYTYENGSLVQIQETIHYTNGNYTYIFTDGSGNLIEEQKVINNEFGGLTFDTTFGNGTRQVIVYDANEHIVNNTHYASDGTVEKTMEYIYDNNNPNLYTIVTKDADGKIITEENCENYSFTDENGLTWYGSRVLKKMNFDTDGNIFDITLFNYKDYSSSDIEVINKNDKRFLYELKNLSKQYQNQLDDIALQLRSLTVPTLPNAADFKLSHNGSVDKDAYNKAMQQYNEQMVAYHNKVDELNQKSMEIQNKLQQVEKQITEIELKTRIEKAENTINSLKGLSDINSDIVSLLKATLDNIKQNLLDLPVKKLALQNKMQNIYSQILSMPVPTPPSANDFKKPDGSVDEKAYEVAFKAYEKQKQEYDEKINKLNAEIAELRIEIVKIDAEIKNQTSELNRLEKNVNAVKIIQDLIDNTDNKVLVQKLNKMLDMLYKNIKAQNEVQEKLNKLFDSMVNETVPIPPSAEDYRNSDGSIDEKAYSEAFAKYEEAKKEYDRKMQQNNTLSGQISNELSNLTNQVSVAVFNAAVAVVESKIAQLRKSANNKEADTLENKLNNLKKEFSLAQKQRKKLSNRANMLLNRLNGITTPNYPKADDFRTANGSIDESAYEQAFKYYEMQSSKYDRITNSINKQLEIISNNLADLDNKIAEILSQITELA